MLLEKKIISKYFADLLSNESELENIDNFELRPKNNSLF